MREWEKTDFYLVAEVVVNQLMACTRVAPLDTKWLILSALKPEEK